MRAGEQRQRRRGEGGVRSRAIAKAMRGPPAPLPHPHPHNKPTPPPASPPRLPEFVKVELATAVIVVFRKQPRRLLLIRVREAGDDALSPDRRRSHGSGDAPSRRSAPLHWRRAAPSRRRRAWCRSRRASTVRRLQQRCSSGPLLRFQSGGSRDRRAREQRVARPSPAGVTLADLFAQRLVLARTAHELLGINAARVVLVLSGHGGGHEDARVRYACRADLCLSRGLWPVGFQGFGHGGGVRQGRRRP